MLKYLFSLITSVVLSVAVTLGLVHNFTASFPTSQLRLATYKITGDFGMSGSGVLISPGRLLTAAHVVANLQNGRVNGPDNTRYTYNILKTDIERDIAILDVYLDCPCRPVADNTPDVDSDVVVVGFPLSAFKTVTFGLVQGTAVQPELKRLVTQISAPVIFGNSGGPVFNKWGEVIGIVSMVSAAGDGFFGYAVPHIGWTVPVETIKDFIKDVSPQKR